MTERKIQILSCLLSFVLGVGVGAGGFGIAKAVTGRSSVTLEEQLPADNGGMLLSEETAGNGVKLMSTKIAAADYAANGISPQAETAYTLTAAIEPESAADKTVDWSIAWENAESKWAKGKTVTDYVTVTPTSDGALTAISQCLQPFGEPMIITVRSRMNTEAAASCTVNFAARPSAFAITNLGLFNAGAVPILFFDKDNSSYATVEPMVADSAYLTGVDGEYNAIKTVGCELHSKTAYTTGDVTINSFEIEGKPTSGLVSALNANGLESEEQYHYLDLSTGEYHRTSIFLVYLYASGFTKYSSGNDIEFVKKLNAAIRDNTLSDYDFDVKLTVDTNIGTYEFTEKIKVNRSASVFGVESVNIESGDIVY